ncbi:MAG: response regulator transcription factor [Chitinophagaceae bacterium]|nr:response regulator transcription factor [Chitinophagaceae bacterium]
MQAIIIEDETLIAKELKAKISAVAPDITILEILPSVKTAVNWINNNAEPDLIFADIQLSDGVSFEIFERYKLNCPIIFATAYDEFAIRAFKVNGIDYLLKPVDKEELKKAIDKVRDQSKSTPQVTTDLERLLHMMTNPSSIASKYKEKFVVKHLNSWIPILISDIAFFCRDQLNYLYTKAGDKFIVDYPTLDDIENLLDPSIFYRANRQYIVHSHSIASYKTNEGSKVLITLKPPFQKTMIDISREKAPTFKKWFEG